jgi:hypothetical protein
MAEFEYRVQYEMRSGMGAHELLWSQWRPVEDDMREQGQFREIQFRAAPGSVSSYKHKEFNRVEYFTNNPDPQFWDRVNLEIVGDQAS